MIGFENFRDEKVRLNTFKGWNSPHVTKEDLALNGFYYTDISDNVRCFHCGIEICQWEADDTVTGEHRRHSPCCEIVKGSHIINLPIDENAWRSLRAANCKVHHNNQLKYHTQSTIYNPRHQEMHSLEKRKKTFSLWPAALRGMVDAICKAGFFYTTYSDNVKCFSCAGEISEFSILDDPMERHILSYPKCQYVNLVKGRDYVKQVTSNSVTPQKSDLPSYHCQRCRVCNVNYRDTVFLPCLHVTTCHECCQSLSACNFCGEEFDSVKRIASV